MQNKSKYIHIGHCVTPHGIKGEFSFVLYNEDGDLLKDGVQINLVPRGENHKALPHDGLDFRIKSIRIGNKVIVRLDGVETRNQVEELVPFDIYINRDLLPETDEDEFYLNDLLGLVVIDHQLKTKIGRVSDFYENGAQIVLKIKGEKNSFEILFINQFVPVVDLEKGEMEIILPEIVD